MVVRLLVCKGRGIGKKEVHYGGSDNGWVEQGRVDNGMVTHKASYGHYPPFACACYPSCSPNVTHAHAPVVAAR